MNKPISNLKLLNLVLYKALNLSLYDLVQQTPLEVASKLSAQINNNILIKREDLQDIFSFKLRGAYAKLLSLTPEKRKQGVITSSAGNHAQGVAYAAQHLRIKATIVMPQTTPEIKVNAVRGFGAKVVLHGDTYDDAFAYAQKITKELGLIFISPYDDLDVISGQATLALELLHQKEENIEYLFVPIGGGGLVSGVISVFKTVNPHVKIIGVESEDSACAKKAIDEGKRSILKEVGIFADGVAVAQIGKHPFKIINKNIDDIITISIDEMCAAIKDIFNDFRTMVEPSGALAIAGMKKYLTFKKLENKNVCAILSGANLNFDRLKYIVERTDTAENREMLFTTQLKEESGSFRKFCKLLGKVTITEFNYRYSSTSGANVFVGIKLNAHTNLDRIKEANLIIYNLKKANYKFHNLSNNAIALEHVRHMVGGRHPAQDKKLDKKLGIKEYIYKFTFPEKPGALLDFLNKLHTEHNISLFHYRNHGDAFGKVLLGIKLKTTDIKNFENLLKENEYSFLSATDNLAYKLFLS